MILTEIKTRIFLLGYFILGLLLISTSEIQADYGMTETATLYSNVAFQKWNITHEDRDISVRQFSVPFFISYPVSQRFHLFISENNSMSKYEEEKIYEKPVSKSFNGIGDTQIQMLSSMANGQILLSCGLNFPTGKNKLKSDEEDIVEFLRQEALDFEIGKLGEGYGLSLGMAFVKPLGPVTFGTGTSYFYKTGYSPTKSDGKEYNPGNLINLTFGFDTELFSTTLRSDFSYTYNTSARLESEEYFRQGNYLDFETELAYQKQRIKFGIIGRGKIKSKDYSLLNGKLQKDKLKHNNDRYELLTFCQYRITSYATLLLSAQRRLVSADDRGEGEAKVWEFNTGTYFKSSNNLGLNFDLKVSRGEYIKDSAQLSGISFSTALISAF